MLGFIVTVVVTAVSLLILARISIGLDVDDTGSALVAALVLGVLNATLRPVLGFLAFPITLLTFGLFSFVLNAIVLYVTAAVVKGFHIIQIEPLQQRPLNPSLLQRTQLILKRAFGAN